MPWTLVDAAGVLGDDLLHRVVSESVRLALTDVQAIQVQLAATPARRATGAAQLRAVLDDARSPPEAG